MERSPGDRTSQQRAPHRKATEPWASNAVVDTGVAPTSPQWGAQGTLKGAKPEVHAASPALVPRRCVCHVLISAPSAQPSVWRGHSEAGPSQARTIRHQGTMRHHSGEITRVRTRVLQRALVPFGDLPVYRLGSFQDLQETKTWFWGAHLSDEGPVSLRRAGELTRPQPGWRQSQDLPPRCPALRTRGQHPKEKLSEQEVQTRPRAPPDPAAHLCL